MTAVERGFCAKIGCVLALRVLWLSDLMDLLGPRSPACVISTFACSLVLAVISFQAAVALTLAAISFEAAAGGGLT